MCGEEYLIDKTSCTRYSGFFDTELIMGGYLSTIFLSIIILINSIKRNWFLYTAIILSILCILIMITGERSATLTILLTLIFTLIQYRANFKIKLISFTFLIALTILMISLNPHIRGRYIDFFSYDMKENSNLLNYEKIATTPWGLHAQKSLKLIIDKPFIGHGIKSFRVKCDNYKLYIDREKKKHQACSTHPHNLILELLTEQGVLGFFLFFAFFFVIFKKSILDYGFFSKDFTLISLRSLIFVLIFIPKPVGSIFSSVNATMIWFCVSLFVFKIFQKIK
jgi:O-antigen ligase